VVEWFLLLEVLSHSRRIGGEGLAHYLQENVIPSSCASRRDLDRRKKGKVHTILQVHGEGRIHIEGKKKEKEGGRKGGSFSYALSKSPPEMKKRGGAFASYAS